MTYFVRQIPENVVTERTALHFETRLQLLEALNEWNRTWTGKYQFWTDEKA